MNVFWGVVFALLAVPCFGQNKKEVQEWVFADYNWVSFATGKPLLKETTAIFSHYACASISDSTGKLLFYTNGVSVWNAKHQVMANGTGLKGGLESHQNVIILPHPANKSLYYIFTAADSHGGVVTTGLHYSIVNMQLDNGLGDIEIGRKNFELLDDTVSQAISATLDCTGKGYWIMTHKRNDNNFYAFHLTENGVDKTPVVSPIDNSQRKYNIYSTWLKFSPNSRQLVFLRALSPAILLYDFDNSTGKVSNLRNLMDAPGDGSGYGSFSPDNSKLYVLQGSSVHQQYNDSAIAQFDISLHDEASIRKSKVNLYTYNTYGIGQMQLASDGKIYIRKGFYFGCIEKPNLPGARCDYKENVLKLQPKYTQGGYSNVNLPDYYFNQGPKFLRCAALSGTFSFDTVCPGNTMRYRSTMENMPEVWQWTFEGGQPAEYEGETPPSIYYEKAGNYTTRLIISNQFETDTIIRQVLVRPLPIADAGADVTVCSGASTILGTEAIAGNTYFWTPSAGLDNPNIAQPRVTPIADVTKYFLKVTNEFGCEAIDSVLVSIGQIKALVRDTSVCRGSSVVLQALGGSEYEWSPSTYLSATTGASVTASPLQDITYQVIAKSGDCRDTAFLKVAVLDAPTADAGNDKEICAGESVELCGVAVAGLTYSWTPGEGLLKTDVANPIASPLKTTEYVVEVTNSVGCVARDTVVVKVGEFLKVVASNDTSVCAGKSVQLSATSDGDVIFKWSPQIGLDNPNIANPIAKPQQTTTYFVTAFKNGGLCTGVDSVTVMVLKAPEITTKDITLCEGESAELWAVSDEEIVAWSWTPTDGLSNPNIQNPVVTAFKNETYLVTARNEAGCEITKALKVEITPKETISAVLKSDKVELEPGESTILKMLLKAENSAGITSFKARITFDEKVFQFTQGSEKLLKGIDNTWSLKATKVSQNQIELEARGQTALANCEIASELMAYLAKQTSEELALKITEINDEVLKENVCRIITEENAGIVLKDVCAGDMRLVNVGEFQTFLKAVAPNPVISETIEIEYEIGIAGNIALEMYNAQGELVKTVFKGNSKGGVFKESISTSELSAGIYLLKLTTAQAVLSKSFSVVR